ncbi:MAG: hypothetical protein R3253_05735 [Longimicrobiales bacterium]|nr:hypothetical protein [Longimicrobiales bacterium]
MPTFDGENLLIVLDSGITEVDVEVDLYSDWKEWFKQGTNSRYPLAFRTTGGDPLTAALDLGAYFFLRNDLGWRIRPPEEDITIVFTGNLAPEDVSQPVMVPTLGGFTVLVAGLQPVTQGVDAVLTLQRRIDKVHTNKLVTDPGTGVLTVYEDDGVTPFLSGAIKEDAAGTKPYAGSALERREKLT